MEQTRKNGRTTRERNIWIHYRKWMDTLQEFEGIHYRNLERLKIEEKKQKKRMRNEEETGRGNVL